MLSINPISENQISFNEMLLAIEIFNQHINDPDAVEDITIILKKNKIFAKSKPLLIKASIRILNFGQLIGSEDFSQCIRNSIDENGIEFQEIDDALIYACAKAELDDEMDIVVEDVKNYIHQFNSNPDFYRKQ